MSPQPILISSWNGIPAISRAAELHGAGLPLLESIVKGVALVEDDPEEMTVGFGGLPNEDGEVELDAAVMDGPRHKVGAVAGLKRIKNPAAVALEVLRRTDHALLVGEGASAFARKTGFIETNLLTDRAREAWLNWKAGLSSADAWISPDEQRSTFGHALDAGVRTHTTGAQHAGAFVPKTWGTIHVSGVDVNSDLFACTSTSGLSYKIPGRVGDSPLAGAGLYVDNAVGSAGATGRGEASLQNCLAFDTVRGMESGLTPSESALHALQRLIRNTREPRLLTKDGRPDFNVTVYALRKDGQFGAASIQPGYTFTLWRNGTSQTLNTVSVFTASTT
jgi:N4-(beta-N-acetylglucosaminyl)-L-asparaginase